MTALVAALVALGAGFALGWLARQRRHAWMARHYEGLRQQDEALVRHWRDQVVLERKCTRYYRDWALEEKARNER